MPIHLTGKQLHFTAPVSRLFACKISATQCKKMFLNLGLDKDGVRKRAFQP